MTRPRINGAQLAHVQRLARLMGSPEESLSASDTDEKQDLIDKYADEESDDGDD